MAQHDAELAKDLKAAREEMARDNLSLAAQLKASQAQIAGIGEQLKAAQEQLNRLAAPKQPRPPKLASPLPQQAGCDPDVQADAATAVTASWSAAAELNPVAA